MGSLQSVLMLNVACATQDRSELSAKAVERMSCAGDLSPFDRDWAEPHDFSVSNLDRPVRYAWGARFVGCHRSEPIKEHRS